MSCAKLREAASSLSEIAAVERRTKAALAYRGASVFLILWDALVACGAWLTQAFPGQREVIWHGIDAAGLFGSCAIAASRFREPAQEQAVLRAIAGFVVLGVYGAAWADLFAPAGHERIAVFWAALMMMGYVVAGLWQGPLFAVLGLLGTALSFAAFLLAGSWLHLWIGAIYAAGFVPGGVWLRRLGAGSS